MYAADTPALESFLRKVEWKIKLILSGIERILV